MHHTVVVVYSLLKMQYPFGYQYCAYSVSKLDLYAPVLCLLMHVWFCYVTYAYFLSVAR